MPKTSNHPRLRCHVRKGANGQRWVYYTYDNRGTGEKDIPLGTDHAEAIRRWDEIHNQAPRIAGTIQEAINRFREKELPGYRASTRRDYTLCLTQLEPAFGIATWDGVEIDALTKYLEKRSAKTRANRELAVLSIIWNHARLWGMTRLHWPAAGLERSRWKNKEHAREIEIDDVEFEAIYRHADQTLRDAMDLITATGMRVKDACAAPLGSDAILRFTASKTGKRGAFGLAGSVVQDIVRRRQSIRADHLLLLSTPSGHVVTERMLGDRWTIARAKAAEDVPTVKRLYLRDLRKRAADLADSDADAAELLQHDDVRLTRKHYRTRVRTLKTTR